MSYGPYRVRPEVNGELFHEAEEELEQNAERYAELHADDPPRGSFLKAMRRLIDRRPWRQVSGDRKPAPGNQPRQ